MRIQRPVKDWGKYSPTFGPDEFREDPRFVDAWIVDECYAIRVMANAPFIVHVAFDSDPCHENKSRHYLNPPRRPLADAVDFHFKQPTKFVELEEPAHRLTYHRQLMILKGRSGLGAIGFYPFWNNPGWHIDGRQREKKLYWVRDDTRRDDPYVYDYQKMLSWIIKLDKEKDD